MLRRKKTKAASLVLSILMLALTFVPVSYSDVGISTVSQHRLTYHFFHANILHCITNVWCFLSCMFLADVPLLKLAAAYVIACSVPVTSPVPTVGLSGVCYALLGIIMPQSKSKSRYNITIAASILLPAAFLPGHVNSLLHAYCYAAGAIVELITRKHEQHL